MIRENGLGEQRPIAGLRLELEGDGCTQLIGAFDTLDEAVAFQFGLNRTDVRCLGILYRHGRLTAGG